MTQIVLPITSRANTDANLYSDVYSGLVAITTVVNGDLRNDNIAAAGTANIAVGKLASGSAAQVVVLNASGVPVYRDLTGDVTVNSGGVTAIGNLKVTTAMVADAAVNSRKFSPQMNQVSNEALSQTISSTTPADLTGITTTFTPAVASKAFVWATFWVKVDDNSHSINQGINGYLNVDGSRNALYAGSHFNTGQVGSNNTFEVTMAQNWLVSLTAAAHTLKLQAGLLNASGTETAKVIAASLTYLLVAS